jgi:hypothetical protein
MPAFRHKAKLSVLLIVFTSIFLPQKMHPQAVSVASIAGRVTDPQGAAVSGAQVKITSTETGAVRSVVTNSEGLYSIPNLPIGGYTLDASAPGFQTYEQTGIALRVNDNIQINISLSVGNVSQQVTVSAAAQMVQTQDNSISQVIDQRRIAELPLNGRQPTQLILISGAAVTAPVGDLTGSKNFYSSTNISVAGGQANQLNYLLDGGDNNDTFSNVNLPFPFPDALREFSVETNALPARNGLHPGGVVNIVTQSGSNQFHGEVFEFLRNNVLNATNFFSPSRDTLKRNQFGGTFGGPVLHNRFFFFGGYQGTRNRQTPKSTTAHIPSQAALNGDWSVMESAACQSNGKPRNPPIKNPYTGQPFANNQVPTSLYNPASLALVKYLPVSSDPCGKVVYGIPTTGDEDQGIVRLDYTFSPKQSLYGRYFLADYRNPAVFDPKNILVTTNPGNLERAQSFTLGDTWTLSPNLVNSAHATITRRRDDRGPAPDMINGSAIGINTYFYVPDDLRLSVGSSSSGFSTSCGTCSPGYFNVTTGQVADDVDFLKGRHQFAFGADFIRTDNNLNAGYLENGNYTFNGQASNDPLLDFMLGVMSGFGQSRPQQVAMRESIIGLYGQDTIHVNSHLVVNIGLRWEPQLFPHDYFHRGSVFSRTAFDAGQKSTVFANAPAGSFYYGDKGVPAAFTKNTLTNFSPRFGLVFDPKGDGRQTFRAGYGLLYDSGMLYATQRLTSNPPFVNEIDLTGAIPFNDPWSGYPGGNPFPVPYPPPSNAPFPTAALYVVLPDRVRPTYIEQWNASYQLGFANNWLFTLSYLGNRTVHVWGGQDINPSVYIPGNSTTKNTQQRRVLYLANPTQGNYYGTIFQLWDNGRSNYNGMVVSVEHRMASNFTVLANYTWSKCMSDTDFDGDIRQSNYQDPNNPAADYSVCNFDLPQNFNLTAVAISHFSGGWKQKLLGNWQIAPLIRISSGMPVNITSGQDYSLTNVGQDRPNLTGNPYLTHRTCTQANCQWLNPASFAANPAGTFGDLRRNAVRTPGYADVDASLSRIFPITERFQVEGRFESFNLLNHPNFGGVPTGSNTNVSSNLSGSLTAGSTFGQIIAAGDPRIMQAAIKVRF